MTANQELPANIQAIVDKVEKLLRLASNNPNEAEAQSAANKAAEILAAYNLDMTIVGQAGGKSNDRREDNKIAGGLYKWQRAVWNGVAKMNFCMYHYIRGLQKGSKYEHRLIGRTANILATRLMAEYLEQAIERITRERFGNLPSVYFSKDGVAFREGMADRICERLYDRRRQAEREAEQAKADNRRRNPGAATALTIVDVKASESKANEEHEYDLRNGAGSWTRMEKRNEERAVEAAKVRAETEAELERFKTEHPEEYAKQEMEAMLRASKEAQREERNARRRKGRAYKEETVRANTYFEGHRRGGDVSLDKQVNWTSQQRIK